MGKIKKIIKYSKKKFINRLNFNNIKTIKKINRIKLRLRKENIFKKVSLLEDRDVTIKYYNEYTTEIIQESRNLISIFDYKKLLQIPKQIYKLRQILQDFNKILQTEQKNYKISELDYLLRTSTSSNSKTNNLLRTSVHNKYNNMCFYCGKKIEKYDQTEGDHVISIIQMFISLVIDKNILFNFERVHKCCNQKAKQKSPLEIWNTIGTDIYVGPLNNEYSIAEVENERSFIKRYKLNRQWCRGYLLMEILKRLNIKSIEEQKARLIMINNSIEEVNSHIYMLSNILTNPGLDVDAANILLDLN